MCGVWGRDCLNSAALPWKKMPSIWKDGREVFCNLHIDSGDLASHWGTLEQGENRILKASLKSNSKWPPEVWSCVPLSFFSVAWEVGWFLSSLAGAGSMLWQPLEQKSLWWGEKESGFCEPLIPSRFLSSHRFDGFNNKQIGSLLYSQRLLLHLGLFLIYS